MGLNGGCAHRSFCIHETRDGRKSAETLMISSDSRPLGDENNFITKWRAVYCDVPTRIARVRVMIRAAWNAATRRHPRSVLCDQARPQAVSSPNRVAAVAAGFRAGPSP
jgi:hypothetical protein